MTSKERRKNRYDRRREKRKEKRQKIIDGIGTAEEILTYHNMFKYGRDCCKGVMWKQSTQNFKRHLFSKTAVNRNRALSENYKPKRYFKFNISERGKTRTIEAPHIDDRQIHKTLTKEVLLPLYAPKMIYDNGASIKDKGFLFSQKQFDKALRRHIRKYGMNGWIIMADFKKFFPSADREIIKRMHSEIKDEKLKNLLAIITDSGSGNKGMPLGVETSQAEMIAFPSPIDNYMSCQMELRGFGHYMDDYHIIVPPDRNPEKILEAFIKKASELNIVISRDKTLIIPFGKPVKYCKIQRVFTGNSFFLRACRNSIPRARRKIRAFYKMIGGEKMKYEDAYISMNSCFAYLSRCKEHHSVLRLQRLFFTLFHFSPEKIVNFRRKDREIRCA